MIALDDYERGQVTTRYREHIARLEQEISDIEQVKITNRMLWRCSALACLRVHQELFSLQNVGFMMMANRVQIGTEQVHLHELLQTFIALVAKFSGLETYYQLPDMQDETDVLKEQPGIVLLPPQTVSILHRGDPSWDGVIGTLQEVRSGDYAILHVPEESRRAGWYALCTEPIQLALRSGLILARSDNWCRGFTFLHAPTEHCCLDLPAALEHIQEDMQRRLDGN